MAHLKSITSGLNVLNCKCLVFSNETYVGFFTEELNLMEKLFVRK